MQKYPTFATFRRGGSLGSGFSLGSRTALSMIFFLAGEVLTVGSLCRVWDATSASMSSSPDEGRNAGIDSILILMLFPLTGRPLAAEKNEKIQ